MAALPLLSAPVALQLVRVRPPPHRAAPPRRPRPAPRPIGCPSLTAHAATRTPWQDFRRRQMVDLPKRTAKFQFLFGLLLIAGVLMPSPPAAALLLM